VSDVFISYARSTAKQAEQISEALRALGYSVWRDDDLPPHRAYAEVIQERLIGAKAVVVVWSSEAAKSEWVQSEADRARSDHKLVQLRIDEAPLPMPFDRIQCADMTGWTGDLTSPGWHKVVGSLAELVGGPRPSPPPRARAATAPLRQLSICVLPFANMSGDPEQEYFSDGISEDIITDLSKVSALYVVARNTAFQFKGKAVDVPVLARQLNVSHVLEGSVRKAGRKVRITAQLIDGAAGGHVWAERYDRDLDDIFALQDEISQAIVGALKLKLLPEEKQAIERRGTDSADAYNLFLMARQYMNAGNRGDPRREEAIVRLCRRATDIDPRYARAWALMAFAQSILVYFHGRSGDDGLGAAERALSLDPQLAEPHAVKAKVFSANARHEEAFAELEIALRLDPESMEVNQRAGNMYLGARRFEEAIGHFSKAAALSEIDYEATGQQIPAYAALGDVDGLRRAAQTTLQRVERAIAQDRSNGGAISFGVIALSVLGETERAREWIGRALLIDPDNMMMRYNFACALSAWAKDADGAIELLGPVFASPQVHLLSLAQTDPDFDPIRGDPRFAAMLAAAAARTSEAAAGSAPT